MAKKGVVAVCGAGPAGLIMAMALARRGIKVDVYEQEGDHETVPRYNPNRSYTIDITGHGLKALEYVKCTVCICVH